MIFSNLRIRIAKFEHEIQFLRKKNQQIFRFRVFRFQYREKFYYLKEKIIKLQTLLIKQQKFNTFNNFDVFIDFDVKNQKLLRFDFHFFKRAFSIFFVIFTFFFVLFSISIIVSYSFYIKYLNVNDFHENKNK